MSFYSKLHQLLALSKSMYYIIINCQTWDCISSNSSSFLSISLSTHTDKTPPPPPPPVIGRFGWNCKNCLKWFQVIYPKIFMPHSCPWPWMLTKSLKDHSSSVRQNEMHHSQCTVYFILSFTWLYCKVYFFPKEILKENENLNFEVATGHAPREVLGSLFLSFFMLLWTFKTISLTRMEMVLFRGHSKGCLIVVCYC